MKTYHICHLPPERRVQLNMMSSEYFMDKQLESSNMLTNSTPMSINTPQPQESSKMESDQHDEM